MRDNHLAWVFLLVAVLLAALAPEPALAWVRFPHVDAQVVERSDAILVGHLVKDSIICVPHPAPPGAGSSQHYSATLVITEVLKGSVKEKEVPVIIQYGLTPVVGGIANSDGTPVDWRPTLAYGRPTSSKPEDYPKDIIEIFDTGGGFGIPPASLVEDAGQDNLWLLRRDMAGQGRFAEIGASYYIADPEDLQPLALKSYYAAHMAKDPEAAVKQEIAGKPALAKRGQDSLTFLEVLRIERNPDAKARAEALAPYFLKPYMFGTTDEVKKALVASGDKGGQVLVSLFRDSKDHDLRYKILEIWKAIPCTGCANTLIDLLNENESFWTEELKTEPHEPSSDPAAKERFNRSNEVGMAIDILGIIREKKAKDIIERTRNLWAKLQYGRFVVRDCDNALDRINRPAPGKT
jgi:hypothetical protein